MLRSFRTHGWVCHFFPGFLPGLVCVAPLEPKAWHIFSEGIYYERTLEILRSKGAAHTSEG